MVFKLLLSQVRVKSPQEVTCEMAVVVSTLLSAILWFVILAKSVTYISKEQQDPRKHGFMLLSLKQLA